LNVHPRVISWLGIRTALGKDHLYPIFFPWREGEQPMLAEFPGDGACMNSDMKIGARRTAAAACRADVPTTPLFHDCS